MLKEFAWNAFAKTGNIDAYVFYKELDETGISMENAKRTEEEVATSR